MRRGKKVTREREVENKAALCRGDRRFLSIIRSPSIFYTQFFCPAFSPPQCHRPSVYRFALLIIHFISMFASGTRAFCSHTDARLHTTYLFTSALQNLEILANSNDIPVHSLPAASFGLRPKSLALRPWRFVGKFTTSSNLSLLKCSSPHDQQADGERPLCLKWLCFFAPLFIDSLRRAPASSPTSAP